MNETVGFRFALSCRTQLGGNLPVDAPLPNLPIYKTLQNIEWSENPLRGGVPAGRGG